MNKISNFYSKYLRNEDKIIFFLLCIAMPLGLYYNLTNLFSTKFSGGSFTSHAFYFGAPLMFVLYSVAIFAREHSPRMSLVTWSYTVYAFMMIVLGALAYGSQFTPFHTIDPLLVKIDQFLGFNQIAVLNWTYAHPLIYNILSVAYMLVGLELSFAPLILALMMQKKSLYILFISLTITFIVGTAIYYFLPTTAPASVFFSPNFIPQQHDTFIKFFETHNHIPLTTSSGGMIAFPSFHVIWSVLLVYAFKNKKYLLYPIILINSLVIASTMMLGWHYLTDVIAAILVSAFAITIAEILHKKYIANQAKNPGEVKKEVAAISLIPNNTRSLPTIGQLAGSFAKQQKR